MLWVWVSWKMGLIPGKFRIVLLQYFVVSTDPNTCTESIENMIGSYFLPFRENQFENFKKVVSSSWGKRFLFKNAIQKNKNGFQMNQRQPFRAKMRVGIRRIRAKQLYKGIKRCIDVLFRGKSPMAVFGWPNTYHLYSIKNILQQRSSSGSVRDWNGWQQNIHSD